MPPASSPRTTVYVHIGPPKTGTTFIQGALRYWHAELREAGVLFPAAPTHDHFNAALDVRGHHRFGIGRGHDKERPRARGAWRRLMGVTLAHDGIVVISHELLATADAKHARRAITDLAGTDLHVVVTVRDPARQLVSSWQEQVKQGGRHRFRRVARRLTSARGWASTAQDLPRVLDNWTQGVPADHVHVVTVPPSGSDPRLLWRRFAGVVGFDPEPFDPMRAPQSNESLGIAEVELLRRVNVALDGRIEHPAYSQIVTTLYANDILAGTRESPTPVLPARLWGRADEIAESWIAHVRSHGYDVRGDLDDIRPHRRQGRAPRSARESDVSAAAVRATSELLLRVAELHEPRHAIRVAARATIRRLGFTIVSTGQQARYFLQNRRPPRSHE